MIAVVDNELFDKYYPIVKSAAGKYFRKIPYGVEYDDLIQAGSIGLLNALKGITVRSEAEMYSYIRLRVVGEIIDQLRRETWMPRLLFKHRREIHEHKDRLIIQLCRDPSVRELASEVGVSVNELREYLIDIEPMAIVDEWDVEDVVGNPYTNIERTHLKERLWDIVSTLPERQGEVIRMCYMYEYNIREVGFELNVSESRVSQIRTQALENLRGKVFVEYFLL